MSGRPAHRQVVQFAKFVVVGLFNTGFAYGLYAALLRLGLEYALANLLALVIGIAVSFTTQRKLVFANREPGRLKRFVLVWAGVYLASIFLISRFIALGFDAYVAGAFALPFTTVLSFMMQKHFVFRTGTGSQDVDARRDSGG